ncbi:MAG: iron-sulfur cluster repair di-iron protein [Verrucomicrobia bacterium]|nr:iron-sulfur cluster repair di-iron protein [Verrucomicrobiota bacterium]
MTEKPFTLESKVGDIVAAHPLLARVFEDVGIDYCCGGKRSLAEVCAARGLDAATLAITLSAAARLSGGSGAGVDPASLSLTALADHIEATHHAYVKSELPALLEKAGRVAEKHAWRDARLPEVAATVAALHDEMFSHMMKEEQILFPIVRELERGAAGASSHCGTIANPIRVMEAEHENAGGAIAHLRKLTDGFTPKPDDCNTHRALLAGLAQFEADLHQHVHKENNVLFPRALALEGQLAGAN